MSEVPEPMVGTADASETHRDWDNSFSNALSESI